MVKRIMCFAISMIMSIMSLCTCVYADSNCNIKIASIKDEETGIEKSIYKTISKKEISKMDEGEIKTTTSDIDIIIPKNSNENPVILNKDHSSGISLFSSQTNEDIEDSLSWSARLTCEYTKKTSGGSSKLLLTKVYGKYIRHDKSVKISSREVVYACKSYGDSVKQWNSKKISSNSFTYNTNYKIYVPNSKASFVGANCGAYLQRGTGKKWYFDVATNICLASLPKK